MFSQQRVVFASLSWDCSAVTLLAEIVVQLLRPYDDDDCFPKLLVGRLDWCEMSAGESINCCVSCGTLTQMFAISSSSLGEGNSSASAIRKTTTSICRTNTSASVLFLFCPIDGAQSLSEGAVICRQTSGEVVGVWPSFQKWR